MPTSTEAIQAVEILKDEQIAAPIDVVFETLLEQLGPLNTTPDGTSLAMRLEAWPGGRWFRDLGNNTGHFWGHVQAIKPPVLLEICGPLFMSYAAISNVQYRLSEENGVTLLKFAHRAIGQIPPEHQENMGKGWSAILNRIQQAAERRGKQGINTKTVTPAGSKRKGKPAVSYLHFRSILQVAGRHRKRRNRHVTRRNSIGRI